LVVVGIVINLLFATFITINLPNLQESKEVLHEVKWGINVLDLKTAKSLQTLIQQIFYVMNPYFKR
jgi:hypothetical protein